MLYAPESMPASSNKNKGLPLFSFDNSGRKTYHNALMSGTLPEYLDLTRAARQPVRLTGQLGLVTLPRLTAAAAGSGGVAEIELQIFADGGRIVVQGRVQATLGMTCQRCLGSMRLPVAAALHMVWVRGEEEAARLSADYELLVSASGRVKLADVVEDELLLALPMAAVHESSEECRGWVQPEVSPAGENITTAPVGSFATLKAPEHR
ncbi:MAG: YceD family protein [Gammaproteobacteria bacterium]